MRGVRAPIPCLVAALALAGCMGRTAPSRRAAATSTPWPTAVLCRPLPRCRSPMRRRAVQYDARLSSRCRRQAARRGLRPGRPHQYLRDRRRRLDHHAADRRGSRARPHAGGACRRDLRQTAQRLSSAIPRSRSRSNPTGRSSSSARLQRPDNIPMCPNMTVESAVAIAGGFSPRARRDRVTVTHTDASGTGALCGAARHLPQPGRYGARRRTLVLIMPTVEGQPLRILHATRAPVGGIFRHILDLANGQAERGHHVGIIADSLTGGERADAGAGGNRAASQARRSPHCHSPRAAPDRRAGMGALPAPDPAAEAGRPARPRRQGRRLHPAARPAQRIRSASTRRMAARCIIR